MFLQLQSNKRLIYTIQEFQLDPRWFQEREGSNQSILLYDNGAGGKEAEVEGNRVLVFGMAEHLNYLCQSPVWLGTPLSPSTPHQRTVKSPTNSANCFFWDEEFPQKKGVNFNRYLSRQQGIFFGNQT